MDITVRWHACHDFLGDVRVLAIVLSTMAVTDPLLSLPTPVPDVWIAAPLQEREERHSYGEKYVRANTLSRCVPALRVRGERA